MRAACNACARAVDSRAFHIGLLCAGAVFLLVGAFHGNVWFDESYSVAIAGHSFSEIWRIGSGDVHPVLFYWALHVLYLVFGANVMVYRLFAVAGAVALAALGLTHVRRDFGPRAGVLFTAFSCFAPYMAVISTEIRMYSWAAFAVALCFFSAVRLCLAVRRAGASEVRLSARMAAPLFASSLAAAYLHYFGALAAFAINVLVLAVLLLHARSCRRAIAAFLCGCAVQVAAYLPWLATVAGQVAVVSNTYWANVVFPDTYIELVTYPVVPSAVSFGLRGQYGAAAQMVLQGCLAAIALCIAAAAVAALVRGIGAARARRLGRPASGAGASGVAVARIGDAAWCAWAGVGVYAGVIALGFAASEAMGSFILYYRYLFVAFGPLLAACAIAAAGMRPRIVAVLLCAALAGCSATNMALTVHDNYDSANRAPLEALAEAAAWAQEGDDAGASGDVAAASETAADTASASPVRVVSSDIGFAGVAAVEFPGIAQAYLDWQPGNWALSYEAYAPALASVKSWDAALARCGDRFVAIGQTSDGSVPRDVTDLDARDDVECVGMQTFYRPYERTYFTVALMEKR